MYVIPDEVMERLLRDLSIARGDVNYYLRKTMPDYYLENARSKIDSVQEELSTYKRSE